MYKIKIKYTDGDSNGTSREESFLEYDWQDADIAEENVDRIIQHYEWYSSAHNSLCNKTFAKPSFVNEKHDKSFALKLDNGQEQFYGAFWIGWGQSLESAQVVIDFPEKSPNIY